MIEEFLSNLYEGCMFKDRNSFEQGIKGAIRVLTFDEAKMIKMVGEGNRIKMLRKILGEKYEEEIRREITFISNNLTEENEWDMIYLMSLLEFYMVIEWD